jgi:hypothetical protein
MLAIPNPLTMIPERFFRVLGGALPVLLLASAQLLAQGGPLSLAGDWRFALDRADAGVKEQWFNRNLADRIKLPGILQAQGYGDEITTTTPWVTTLGDAWWKLQPAALRDHFSQPGHVEVPFIAQPPRHYLGAAWYQRDIEIPATGAGRRFVLFLERAHWETTVWVDDRAFAPNHSLVAPHVTDLGSLAPGRHRLSIRVDNRQIVRDPANDGHGVDSHSVSDSLGATWNGIVGRIELSSTGGIWIDDVQAYPDVAKKSVRLKVRIAAPSDRPGTATLAAGSVSAPISWPAGGVETEITVPLAADAAPWDEFHPNLQHLTVTLKGSGIDESRAVTFGLREVSHDDKTLLVNGRPVNLRTTHSGGDFPLTGYPATDVTSWRRIFQVCKEYGLNGMRFHSWCPPDAAFTAADELGFYLQPECGMWSPFNPGSVYTQLLEDETARLLRAFGNHPSFILLSPSNEPAGRYQQVTPKWAAAWYEKDNRRLYSAGTGWSDPAQVNGGAQYAALVRFGTGELRNTSGWFGKDYRAALENVHIPVLAHEVGQWCAYPDFDVIKEFTGYLRPSNYDIFRYIAEQEGVLDQNHAFARASGRFQLACYKEEIEANLRTPGLAGYQLLDLHDYLGQGTALIGLVDAFWKPKSYVTPIEFRRFNNTTVPLARLTRRVFTTAETLGSEVEIYHFGEAPIAKAKPYWQIVGRPLQVCRAGRVPPGRRLARHRGGERLELLALSRPDRPLDAVRRVGHGRLGCCGGEPRGRWQGTVPSAGCRPRCHALSADEERARLLEHPDDGAPAAQSHGAIRRDAGPVVRPEVPGARGIPDGGELRLAMDPGRQRREVDQSGLGAARTEAHRRGDRRLEPELAARRDLRMQGGRREPAGLRHQPRGSQRRPRGAAVAAFAARLHGRG